jgi:hypothetical protein
MHVYVFNAVRDAVCKRFCFVLFQSHIQRLISKHDSLGWIPLKELFLEYY